MRKTVFLLVLSIVLLILPTISVAAVVKIDGETLLLPKPPIIEEGTTLVPMRALFEAIGATIKWDDATWSILAIKGSRVIALAIDYPWATISEFESGKPDIYNNLSKAPRIIEESTYVPLRFVSEALNSQVAWDETTETITIKTSKFGGSAPSQAFLDNLRKTITTNARNYKKEASDSKVLIGATIWVNLRGEGWQPGDLLGIDDLDPLTITDINWQPGEFDGSFRVTLKHSSGKILNVSVFPLYKLGYYFHLTDPFEKYPDWSKEVRDAIKKHQVTLGMNKEQVKMAWGEPIRINRTILKNLTHEQWVYGLTRYLYFENDILTAIQD